MEILLGSLEALAFVILAIVSLVLAVVNIRLRRDAVRLEESYMQERREKQMAVDFLHDLAVDSDSEGGRDSVYPHLIRAAVRGTGALAVCLFESTSEGRLKAVANQGLFPPQKPLPEELRKPGALRSRLIDFANNPGDYEPGESLIGAVARSGQAILVAEADGFPLLVRHEDSALRTHSIIVAPITFRGKNFGILAVANPENEGRFDDGDFSFVKSLAEQGGVALHLRELFALQSEKAKLDFDLTLASGVQKLLLPHNLPRIAGLDLHACYRPAKQVGGDLYDVVDLGEGRIGVIAADVSGKGISASLVMAMAHTHLRHLMRNGTSAAELLRRLNAEMIGEIQRGMFITIACAIIDTRRHSLTLARAGHELPLLLSGGEGPGGPAFVKLKSEGMAIGIVPPAVFDEILTEVTVPFRPGAVLVFFTDGLTEARNNAGDEFGAEGLARIVQGSHHYSARDINQEILAALEDFCEGNAPHDDLTLVTVKCDDADEV